MAAFSAASYKLFLRIGAPSCSSSSSSSSLPSSAGSSPNSLLAGHATNGILGSSSPAFTQLQDAAALSTRGSSSISHLADDLVLHQTQGRQPAHQMIAAAASATGLLSLEEAFQATTMKEDHRSHKPAGLESFMEHVRYCNSGSEHRSKFIPFVVDNVEVGYIHPNFLRHLLRFPDVFIVVRAGAAEMAGTEQHSNGHARKVNGVNGIKASMVINGSSRHGEGRKGHVNDIHNHRVVEEEIDGLSAKAVNNQPGGTTATDTTTSTANENHQQQAVVTLHPGLRSREARTEAVNRALKLLSDKGIIPGWRNEFYPVVKAFGTKSLFSLERAAVPYFGIKAYAIHVNGFVQKSNGEKYLWVARRSITKPTFPGMFDHLVAGGQPEGLSCKENVIKECDEEASIPRSISERAKAVGATSYEFIEGERFDRFILFCYDLELPADFIPVNKDGEVDSFTLVPVTKVARILQTTRLYKPDCALVIIDFLFRHGYLSSDQSGYLELLQSLRKGDCI